MPVLINVLHQSKEEERKALVENLASLVSLLRQHLRKWIPELLHLIHIFWNADSQLQGWLLKLISELAGTYSVFFISRIGMHHLESRVVLMPAAVLQDPSCCIDPSVLVIHARTDWQLF